jgi:UDPglucose--hexose-1-phosphate uridylyltransferase
MSGLQSGSAWEERWHPLREEWVVIAAHRQNRPWIGATVERNTITLPDYLPDCYLCPGNQRISGNRNPVYPSTYVFDNDHPCVDLEAPQAIPVALPYRSRPAHGFARVVCYSPRHDLTLAELSLPAIEEIVGIWQQQTFDLGKHATVHHVHCFENKGDIVGVSNPHPHGQVYATNFVFKTIADEVVASLRYHHDTGRGLFDDLILAEQKDGRRILFEDEQVIAFVPYFARYAYEVYLAPKRRVPHIHALNNDEVVSLARALKELTVRYDNLWKMPFPYVMALHQAPTDGAAYRFYHCFLAFHPPLRRPQVQKFLAGPEIGGGNFISDTLPEEKAAELLAVSTLHYRARKEHV